MARADTIGADLAKAFPGLRVTSTVRSRAEQDALIAAGKTRAKNSQHLSGDGLDVVLPKGVTPQQVNAWLSDRGITPGEFLNESGKGSNQGTGAHLHIGLAPRAKGGDQASAGGGSSFDRAKAARDRASGPSMQAVYEAYRNTGKPGGMTPQEAAQFELAVNDGHIMLPRGGSLRSKPAAPVLPPAVVQAYNSHAMDDDPEARAEIERQVAAGAVSLPKGMRLQAPKARTLGERLGMAGRAALEGLGDLAGMAISVSPFRLQQTAQNAGLELGRSGNLEQAANVGAATFNALGPEVGRASATRYSDAAGLAKPESDSEKLTSAIITGGTQGLALGPAMGAESLAQGLRNTVLDTISGATSGGAAETARQAGAGPVGQIAAGLIGGAAPIGLAGSVARIRAPKDLPAVVAETPRAAVIDEAGNLTPHGQEIATRHGVSPEDVVAAYEAPPTVQRGTANDQMPEVQAREATTGQPVSEAPPVREAPQETPPPAQAEAPVARAPEIAPTAEPVAAPERVQQAENFGFGLSKGMATKDFAQQVREQNLAKMDTPEGEAFRAWKAKNAEDIKTAADKFTSAMENPALSDEQRGAQLQESLIGYHEAGKEGVRALYTRAAEMPGSEVALDHAKIMDAADSLILETPMEQGSKDALERAMAKYGLLGDKVETNGRYSSIVTDDGRKIRILGQVEPLTLKNAESFRQAMNAAYDPKGLMSRAIKALDDTVDEAVLSLADGNAQTAAYKTARAARRDLAKTFESKDVVADIVGWKNGAVNVTGKLSPEQVISRAFGKTSDLRRIKAVLLSRATPESKAMWRGLQAHGVAKLFKEAEVVNANIAGDAVPTISGAKLNTAIEKFGRDKLKVLLDDPEYNAFMKLRQSIADATIPINGTVPVGSAPWWQRVIGGLENKATAAFSALGASIGGLPGAAIGGAVGQGIGGAVKSSREAKVAAETLRDATEYTAKRAATDTGEPMPSKAAQAAAKAKQATGQTIRAFIDTYSTPRVLAPVLASTTGKDQ